MRVPLDFFVMYVAFFIAREIRLITDGIPGVVLPIQTLPSEALVSFWFYGAFLYILLFASHKLYSLQISNSKIWEILDIIRYSMYWFVFYSVGIYLWNGIIYTWEEIPRLIILFSMILWMFWSILIRLILNIFQWFLLRTGVISKRNILIISNVSKKHLEPILLDIQGAKVYNILWYANSEQQKEYKIKYFSDIETIESYMSSGNCDEILYIDSDYSKKDLYAIWELSRIYGVRYRYITNNFDVTKTNTTLSLINKTPVIELENTPLENWKRIWKRFFDIIVSVSILIIWLPVYILIALLIKLEDPSWPVIYKNVRIWQNGKLFNCFKFRYLKWEYCIKESYGIKNQDDPAIEFEKNLIEKNNGRSGALYKISKDPRKTRIWKFLEKYSLDEIPQFLNVLLWEMSIIWPRPHQPREVEKYEKYQKRLLTIKPGITGMAQVNGREQNNFEIEAKLDIFYIENWSFLLDMKIMFKTFAIIFSRK